MKLYPHSSLFAITLLGSLLLGQTVKGQTLASHRGVTITKTGNHYLQIIDLAAGASLVNLTGAVDNRVTRGPGYYGPIDPKYYKRYQGDFWAEFQQQPNAVSLVNGQFFSLISTSSCLSFPVRDGHRGWISGGCESPTTYPTEANRLLMEIYPGGAVMSRLYSDSVTKSSANFAMVGLVTGKNLKGSGEQTIFGLGGKVDPQTGLYTTLYILTSASGSEANSLKQLKGLAAQTMLMDGGRSAFLTYKDNNTAQTVHAVTTYRSGDRLERPMPHAIGILAAPAVPVLTRPQKVALVFAALEQLNPSYFPANSRSGALTSAGQTVFQRYHNGSILLIQPNDEFQYYYAKQWQRSGVTLDELYARFSR